MIAYEIYKDPISKDNAVGSNIEYDAEYLKLLELLKEKPEQEFGEVIIEAKTQNWEQIYNLASEILLDKSKDLTVMSYFCLSAIHCYGVNGLYQGLKIIEENLNMYWEDLYPNLYDEDNEFDSDYRVNSLSTLNSNDGLIKILKSTVFVKNRLSNNQFTFKEIEKVLENPNESQSLYPGGLERLYVDLKISASDINSEISLLIKAAETLKEIKKIFDKKVGSSELRLDNIESYINKFTALLNKFTTPDEVKEEPSKNNIIPQGDNHYFNWNNIDIKSRSEIDLLLEKIYLYFEKNEPSHPAPLFIRRIQRLMTYNFYEIMKDISPESMDQLINLVGQPSDNNSTE